MRRDCCVSPLEYRKQARHKLKFARQHNECGGVSEPFYPPPHAVGVPVLIDNEISQMYIARIAREPGRGRESHSEKSSQTGG